MFQRHFEHFLAGPTVERGRALKHLAHARHAGGVPAADVTVEDGLANHAQSITR